MGRHKKSAEILDAINKAIRVGCPECNKPMGELPLMIGTPGRNKWIAFHLECARTRFKTLDPMH